MRKILSLLTVLLLFAALAFSQTRQVTGRVTNERGEPIPFATIKVKGGKGGVAADADGNFRIQAKTGDVLVLSATGAISKEVPVGTESTVNVALTKTNEELTSVVVTALGVKKQSRETGFATAVVGAKELNQAKVTNIANGLTAKVSGLQINTVNNGVDPATRITLRGNRSILGNNQALLVLDGVPVSLNYLNSINPNDVDNVTVLKGATASALYGSDASNGVIIITTKKGGKRPIIKVSNTTTFESISYLPKLQNKFGSYGGEQYNAKGGVVIDPLAAPYFPYENQSYGPAYDGSMQPLGGPVRFFRPDGSFFDSTLMVPYAPNNDKLKFFDVGVTMQNDISFATGDDNSSFYISMQDVNIKGVVPGDKARRTGARINGMRQYGRFRVDYGLGYTKKTKDEVGGEYSQGRPVYWNVINTPQHVPLTSFKDITQPFADVNGYFNAYYPNPYWAIQNSRNKGNTDDLLGNITLNLKVLDWLSLTGRLGYTGSFYDQKNTTAGVTFADWAKADPLNAGNIPSSLQFVNPSSFDLSTKTSKILGDLFASINKDLSRDLNMKLLVGTSVSKQKGKALAISSNSLFIPDFYNTSAVIGQPVVLEEEAQRNDLGAYADLTFGYRDFLFLHATARNDWTSVLSADNRSFFYPSVDGAFVFTDAFKGLQGSKFLSYGKIRAAYSEVGQVSLPGQGVYINTYGAYNLENIFNVGFGFPFGGTGGYTLDNNYKNPNIKPERTVEKEIGIELGFLNNRINFQAAYFDAKTTDQTLPVQISAATGYSGALLNTGSMSNKGVELDLKVSPIVRTRNGFRWDIGANFSYIENEVLSVYPGLDEVVLSNAANWSISAIVGKPYPSVKASDWVRDDQGRVIVDRTTGYPTLDPNLKYFGNTNPTIRLGLNTSFSFKGLTLSAVADYRGGNVIYNAVGSALDFGGISYQSAQANRQRFVFPNSVVDDGTGKLVPNTNIITADGNWRFWANTYNTSPAVYITSAAYWKLRELTLTYELPKELFSKVNWIKGATFGLIGRNLLMLRPKENFWTDPEFNENNSNAVGRTTENQTPPTRIVGFNVTLTF